MLDQTLLWYRHYLVAPVGTGRGFLYEMAVRSWQVFRESQGGLWLAGFGAFALHWHVIWRSKAGWVIAGWLLAAVLGILAGGSHFYGYYYVALVPPLSVLGGWALADLWLAATSPRRAWLVVTSVVLVIFTAQFQTQVVLRAWNDRLVTHTLSVEERVARLVASGPEGPLFVWGNESQLYALSGRPPASRFLHGAAITAAYGDDPQSIEANRQQLLRDLGQHTPTFVAVNMDFVRDEPTASFPPLQELLNQQYELVAEPTDANFRPWAVFRVREQRATPESKLHAHGCRTC